MRSSARSRRSSRSSGARADNVSLEATYPSARWRLEDGTRWLVNANPSKNGRTSVQILRERLASPDDLDALKAELQRILATL